MEMEKEHKEAMDTLEQITAAILKTAADPSIVNIIADVQLGMELLTKLKEFTNKHPDFVKLIKDIF